MVLDRKFLLVSGLIMLFFGFIGFYLVPNWGHYIQSPEQRFRYLTESIWCPI